MCRRILTKISILALVVIAGSAWAVTIHVPEDYDTIQEAVDHAVDGDSILVAPGEYDGFYTEFGPNDITLIGAGAFCAEATYILSNTTHPEYAASVRIDDSFGWNLSDFVVLQSTPGVSAHGVDFDQCEEMLLERVWIKELLNATNDALCIWHSTNIEARYCLITTGGYDNVHITYSNSVRLRNLTVSGPSNGIIVRQEVGDELIIENCLTAFNGDDGIEFPGTWAPYYFVQYNNSYGNSGGGNYSGFTPDPSNLEADPLFVGGSGWQSYQLQEGSPCIDAGNPASPLDPDGTRADIGCFYYHQGTGPTPIPEGPVSGTWTASGSPYHVLGEIHVPEGESLEIEPGVDVIFMGHYKFNVFGLLEAIGTEGDSILFTAEDTTEGWHGLRFLSADSDSRLEYCHISYGKAFGEPWQEACGGGIYCIDSDPTIAHCLIENCYAEWGGGGINCHYCNPSILHNTFRYNHADNYGGGFDSHHSDPYIYGNKFIENTSFSRAGAINFGTNAHPAVINNLIVGNSATYYGGAIFSNQTTSSTEIVNNTIVGNIAQDGGGVWVNGACALVNCILRENFPDQIYGYPEVTFSNIQGGWPGTGNIDGDPLFVAGHYLSQIAAGQTQQSPCVNSGDPDAPMIEGTTRTDGVPDVGIVDMGYHYATGSGGPVMVAGEVNGVWASGTGPYHVVDEIWVPDNQELVIQPGVAVIFMGHYKFFVYGSLIAAGAEGDSILFTAENTIDGWGGIRFDEADGENRLAYCIIQHGNATGSLPEIDYGGGVYSLYSDVVIEFCHLHHNNADNHGGAIYLAHSNGHISNCLITENRGYKGGGIWTWEGTVHTTNNIITYNEADHSGAGIHESSLGGSIINNLVAYNECPHFGGGIVIDSDPEVRNNTIVGNVCNTAPIGGGGGIFTNSDYEIPTVNCIIYGNEPNQIQVHQPPGPQVFYSDIQGGWTGSGNIDEDPLFVAGHYLSQIAAGQAQQSPCVNAGDPDAPMIEGTTRTDGVPDLGIVDIGYHYASEGLPPPPQSIVLEPYGTPIVIPPGGDSFAFDATVSNNVPEPATFDVWLNIEVPGGVQFTVLDPIEITLDPDSAITRLRMLFVPPTAPPGEYLCVGAVGEYPWNVTCSDAFPFIKEGPGSGWNGSSGWSCTGEPFPGEIVEEQLPDNFVLAKAFPNPFNPQTTIQFALPRAGEVKLIVYDITGREVTRMVDGFREAGWHSVTFDAEGFASGLYIYRLDADGFVGHGKMVLLK